MSIPSRRPRALPAAVSALAGLVALALPAVLVVLVGAPAAPGQCPLAKLTEAASNDLDDFGSVALLDGDTAFVGERGVDSAGTVHVFERVGLDWVQSALIQPDDSAPTMLFGGVGDALAHDAGTLFVGAEGDDEFGPDSGSVYVFLRDELGTPGNRLDDVWVQTQELNSPAGGQHFGSGVAVRGGTAVAGQRSAGVGVASAGIFVREDMGTADPLDDLWILQQTVFDDGAGFISQFGKVVDVADDEQTVYVGDRFDATSHAGSIYTFHRDDGGTPADPLDDTWAEGNRITLPPGSDPDSRLDVFAVDGGTVLVGADEGGGFFAGLAYVFERHDAFTPDVGADDVWVLTDMLAPVLGLVAGFGRALDVDGDRAVVGAPLWQFPPSFGHLAFAYERRDGDWVPQATLRAPDEQVNDGFGTAVSLDGERVLIGARGAEYIDDWAPADGAAYEFDLGRPNPWSTMGHGFFGYPEVQLSAWGCLDSEAPVSLRMYNGFDFTGAGLVIGLSQVNEPLLGQTLVPSPDFVLLGLVTGPWGDLTLSGNWFRDGEVPPGVELYFQMWGFDPEYLPEGARASNTLMVTTE